MAYKHREALHHEGMYTYEQEVQSHNEVRSGQHAGLEITIATSMPMEFQYEKDVYKVIPGHCVVYNSGLLHHEVFAGETMSYRALRFDENTVRKNLNHFDIRLEEFVITDLLCSPDTKLSQWIELAFTTRQMPAISCELTDLLNTQILYEVLVTQKNNQFDKIQRKISQAHWPDLVSKVKKLMAERLQSGDLSVETLSAEIGISPFHLIRTFKKVTGHSPISYYRKLRAQAIAISEFRHPKRKVIDQAFDLNFKSLSSYYTTKKLIKTDNTNSASTSSVIKLPELEFVTGTTLKD